MGKKRRNKSRQSRERGLEAWKDRVALSSSTTPSEEKIEFRPGQEVVLQVRRESMDVVYAGRYQGQERFLRTYEGLTEIEVEEVGASPAHITYGPGYNVKKVSLKRREACTKRHGEAALEFLGFVKKGDGGKGEWVRE